MANGPITLTTDFGLADHFVGTMKGVILGIAPKARIVDITHAVPAFNVRAGAFALEQAWRYFPSGSVHVVVVDPGVGSVRRPIAVRHEKQYFVGPDNGIFSEMLGGQRCEVREIANPRWMRTARSSTFHGRDIFAPTAAMLASGEAFSKCGPRIADPVVLPPLEAPQVLAVDRFGNLVTSVRSDSVAEGSVMIRIGRTKIASFHATYSDGRPGELFLIAGSSGYLEVSIREASAATHLNAVVGTPIVVTRR